MEAKLGIGELIKTSRIKQGLTCEQLAEQIDVSPTHIRHMESEHRLPSITLLLDLAKTLHFSLDALVISESDVNKEKIKELNLLLQDCSEKELDVFLAALRELKK